MTLRILGMQSYARLPISTRNLERKSHKPHVVCLLNLSCKKVHVLIKGIRHMAYGVHLFGVAVWR